MDMNHDESLGDEVLLDGIRRRDRWSFDQLFERYVEYATEVARRQVPVSDALDIAQDVWGEVWGTPPILAEGVGFRRWLERAIRRRVRALQRHRSRLADASLSQVGSATSISTKYARIEVHQRVWEAFERGDLSEHDVLNLTMISSDEHVPSSEVGECFGVSSSAVRDSFRRTLKKVRGLLQRGVG